MRWGPASLSSVASWISAGSTTAVTSPSRDAPCGRPPSTERSIPTGSCPTSACARRSAFLPGPALGVARGDLPHHPLERVVEVDPLRVREADHDEQNVGELHRDRALRLFRPLGFPSETVVDLARELADFLDESGEVRERWEVSFLILADPAIDRLLGFAQGHRRLRALVNADLPPLVAPLRGERYVARERLSALIAPPYDVIAKEDRARYAARDPHNIVHLILPEAPPGQDRYARAAAALAEWRRDGVLQAEAAESVYVVAQDYALPSGERRTRVGMFAAVRAEPFETRRVRPHERTHSAPKADRLALLQATRTSLESIFLLAPDPDRALARALTRVTGGAPPAARAELDGVGIRLWVVSGEAAAELARLAGRAARRAGPRSHGLRRGVPRRVRRDPRAEAGRAARQGARPREEFRRARARRRPHRDPRRAIHPRCGHGHAVARLHRRRARRVRRGAQPRRRGGGPAQPHQGGTGDRRGGRWGRDAPEVHVFRAEGAEWAGSEAALRGVRR